MVVIYDRRLMSMEVWVFSVFLVYAFEVKLRFMRFSCVLLLTSAYLSNSHDFFPRYFFSFSPF